MAALLRADPLPDSRWLVLIDGLDEVTAADVREQLLRAVAAYTADYPHLYRFIIATRPATESELAAPGPRYNCLRACSRSGLRTCRPWPGAGSPLLPNPTRMSRHARSSRRCSVPGSADWRHSADHRDAVPAVRPVTLAAALPGSRGAMYGEFVEHLHEHYSDQGPGGLHDQTEADMLSATGAQRPAPPTSS